MEIGTLLRKLRDKRGLTTRNVAEQAGVSLSSYIDWEHGKSIPSLKSFIKLSEAFEVSPVDMMAYFTSQPENPALSEDKKRITDLTEMLADYKNYVSLLQEDKNKMKEELEKVNKLLEMMQSTSMP